jgi:protocatechuate 3,4-dioxygenase beta subunit
MKRLQLAALAALLLAGVVVYLILSSGGDDAAPQPERGGTGLKGKADAERGLTATVTVLEESGTAAGGAELELIGPERRTAATEGDGTARLEGLPPGLYYLLALKGHATAAADFELTEDTDLALRLASSVAIRGHAYDTERAPLPGAVVEAVVAEEHLPRQGTGSLRLLTEPEAVVAHARADETGAYELLVPQGGTFALRASAHGLAKEGDPARVYAKDIEDLDFLLTRGAPLEGRVVDTEGRPVPGARILVLDARSLFGRLPKTEGIADPDGSFALSVRAGADISLVVRATGYALHMEKNLRAPARDLVFTLERGIAVRLRTVREEDPDVPASGVHVVAMSGSGLASGQTGEDGEVVLEHLETAQSGPLDQKHALLWGDGYVPRTLELEGEPEGGVLDVGDVPVSSGGVVRGKVLDAETDEPVAGARVYVLGGFDEDVQGVGVQVVVTGEDGAFELTGVPLGAAVLVGDHPDYVSNLVDPAQRALQNPKALFPKGLRAAQHDVRLAPGATVQGRVVGPDGEPVAGAIVETPGAAVASANFGLDFGKARTDPEGAFTLRGLPAGQVLPLRASHRAYGDSAKIMTQAGQTGVTLQLAPPARLHGTVFDEVGEPIAGVPIRVRQEFEDPFVPGLYEMPAVTDLQGRFHILNPPAGALEVVFDDPGYGEVKLRVRVPPGATDVDLGRTVLERGHGIRGVVLDAEGRPQRVQIRAFHREGGEEGEGRESVFGRTDAAGCFALFGLRPGAFELRVEGDALYAPPVRASTDTKDVRIVVRQAATLTGRVTSRGQPVAGAAVDAHWLVGDQRDHVPSATTRPDGSYRLAGLPPDRPLTLRIEHALYRDLKLENVNIGSGTRDFELEPGASIAGIVVDPHGVPVANAEVAVRFPVPDDHDGGYIDVIRVGAGDESSRVTRKGPGFITLRTGADGRFEIGGLPEQGPITVELEESDQGFIPTEPVEVSPNTRSVRLTAAPAR